METVAHRFPLPPADGMPIRLAVYERGRANDSLVHATHRTLAGVRALCDDQLRVSWLDGRFSPFAADVCEDCARRSER